MDIGGIVTGIWHIGVIVFVLGWICTLWILFKKAFFDKNTKNFTRGYSDRK